MLKKILKFDWIMMFTVVFLIGVGLLSLYSISLGDSQQEGMDVFSKQLIFVVIGIGVLVFFACTDYHYLRSYCTAIYFFSLILLIAVLIWGSTVRGTVGWLEIGAFHIQPVEIAKLALIVFLASFIAQKKMELSEIFRFFASFVMTGIMVFLVLRQPDFGSAMVLAAIWAGMLLISGMSRKTFLILIAVIFIISSFTWMVLADYQKDRLVSLLKPEIDPQGSGYNLIQARVAVGSGGLTGKGIGHGSQSQLNFLPEKHNDFIFAVIAEELGLLGAIFVILLFAVLFFRMRVAALSAPDNFGYLLVTGILVMFFVQTLINIGMNIGLVPITGLSLPLLSYGGSFLLVTFACLGIVLSVWSRKETAR
jgi:rod shape determining protein RodA